MADGKGLPLIILGVVALIAIIGLVLLFRTTSTGGVIATPPTVAPGVAKLPAPGYGQVIRAGIHTGQGLPCQRQSNGFCDPNDDCQVGIRYGKCDRNCNCKLT